MMNLDKTLSREKMRVTVEVDGERREYTENFIVMHMGEDCGTVVGSVGPIEMVKAVDMLMAVMKDMSPMDVMMMTTMIMIMMNEIMEERVKSE